MSSARVSIVIPLYNQVAYTTQCLEALAATTPDELDYEVVLVDNASSDGTSDLLAQLEGDVVIQRNADNLGFARACNQGARLASGAVLVFLNNDTIPMQGWLEGLLEALTPGVGAVGNKLLFPDGTIQHCGVVLDANRWPCHFLYKQPLANHPFVEQARDYPAVTAACIAVPREVFETVGGFDEAYVNGYEDIDLCLKIAEAGFRVRYTPKSQLIHFGSVSEGRGVHEDANLRLFLERWAAKVPETMTRFGEAFRTGSAPEVARSATGESPSEAVPPLISIVIPCYNKAEVTARCLEALARHTPAGRTEFVLVDNGSTDGTPELLASLPDAHVLTNATNLGFARACNQGLRAARGEYVMFLNNDTEVHAGWLEPLVAALEADPGVAAVGPKLVYPDGTIQHAGISIGFDPVQPFGAYHTFQGLQADAPQVAVARDYQVLTAAALMVRRAIAVDLGGFDEGYRNGFEDVDFGLRLGERGHRLRYIPTSVVTHAESQTPGRHDHEAENLRRLMTRWAGRVRRDRQEHLIAAGQALFFRDGDLVAANRDGSHAWRFPEEPSYDPALLVPYQGKHVIPALGSPQATVLLPAQVRPIAEQQRTHRVSVVLRLHNEVTSAVNCLQALAEVTSEQSDFELVLIDDGSTDETPALLAGLGGHVAVWRMPARKGPTATGNLAARVASGQVMVFLPASVVPWVGWLETLLDALEPGVSAVRVGLPQNGEGTTPGSTLFAVPRTVFEQFAGFDPAGNDPPEEHLWHRIQTAGHPVREVVAPQPPRQAFAFPAG